MAFKRYYTLVRYTPSPEPPTPTPTYPTPFYVEDLSGSENTISIGMASGYDAPPSFDVETSTDGTTWTVVGNTSQQVDITVPANGRVYIRCETDSWALEPGIYHNFYALEQYQVGGNIMSLLYGSNFTGSETSFPVNSQCNFYSLFGYSDNLVDASNLVLPATTLTGYCYQSMFEGCTALGVPPTILADTLAEDCCRSMFSGCSALVVAPNLPATTLAAHCYDSMFYMCYAITSAPALPATTLAEGCYMNMFADCQYLTQPPTLDATTLAEGCYASMFSNCTSLMTAPTLPAPTLASYCYSDMFNYCTALVDVTCLATDISAQDCTMNWLFNVGYNGYFYKDPNMNDWLLDDPSGIPTGWTVM